MRKPAVSLSNYTMLNMNIVIRFMILADVIWNGALGLLGPIFALYIVDFIDGGNPAVAGVSAAIYLVTKSLFQIPAASIIDKIPGEKDDFWILFVGALITACFPFAFLFIHTPLQLYIVQFFHGLVIAFTFPSFMAIFTRHIDKDKEGLTWGAYFTFNDLGMAITASIGGVIATMIGFKALIVAVGLISIISALFFLPLRSHMRMPESKH